MFGVLGNICLFIAVGGIGLLIYWREQEEKALEEESEVA